MITIPRPPFQVSDETAKTIASLTARDEALSAAQEKHAEEISALSETEWSPELGRRAALLRDEKLSHIHEARAIRVGVSELCHVISQTDRPAAKDRAFAELEHAKQSVIAALAGIGFEDAPCQLIGGRNPVRDSGIIFHHPAVIAADRWHNTVSDYSVRDCRMANQSEIEKLDRRIERARTEATAGLM